MNEIVRELQASNRDPKTFELQMGDTIIVSGFAFQIVKSGKLNHSLTRKPTFKEVDGVAKVTIWECQCGKMLEDAEYHALSIDVKCECGNALYSYIRNMV